MARKARFTLSLTQLSSDVVTVQYETQTNTAIAGSDYTHTTGTATFPPGQMTRYVDVPVRASDIGQSEVTFRLELMNPIGVEIGDGSGLCTLPGSENVDRFAWVYANLHNNAYGYFGPQEGPNAFAVPRHIPEFDSRIINEAPDYGGETVSETASFWVGLEAWRGRLTGDWSGYNNAWNKIEQFYVPGQIHQPNEAYNVNAPASYVAESITPADYPNPIVFYDAEDPDTFHAIVGVDPLADELEATYGNKRVYLMHWIIDVEGAYGFHNADGAEKLVFINTYERGLQESAFESITHGCWNDWENGGNQFGYEPLYVQGKNPLNEADNVVGYPDAPNVWATKFAYTNAPDSEARAIQWAFWAQKFSTAQGSSATIAPSQAKAKKMGDYLRYNLFDKFFRVIGDNQKAAGWNGPPTLGDPNYGTEPYASCHYLINWYSAWGGDSGLNNGGAGQWSYRVGCSECHQGYQSVTTAYAMATGGGDLQPLTASAAGVWLGSLYRQIEMIRWLQSPEGPIAGGVTNSFNALYQTATDGRQNAQFYGMYYTYSPVWHDPPSNNWVGFQAWGHGRTADLFLEVSNKATPLAVAIRPNLEIILDRLVAWFLEHAVILPDGGFTLPSTLKWVSETVVGGQTTTTPNLEGVYEFIPTLNWPGTSPDYAAFWDASTVPNPNLHCEIMEHGTDLGCASSVAYMLITYAEAKRRMGKFTTPIPNTSRTPEEAFVLAKNLLDEIWNEYRDEKGVAVPEIRSDYIRMGDTNYVPAKFTGAMPNGDPINTSSTFISIRSFLEDDPKWPEVAAYIAGTGPAPVFTYHRFWAQVEYAIACAAIRTYFNDLEYSIVEDLPIGP